jgi:hypothetical protein
MEQKEGFQFGSKSKIVEYYFFFEGVIINFYLINQIIIEVKVSMNDRELVHENEARSRRNLNQKQKLDWF